MKISIIFYCIVCVFCTVVLCLSTHDTLKTSYYSNNPNITIVNGQIVQICNYKVELSENGVNKFKEEISNDFFNTENIKYETYDDFYISLERLEKLVKCFDNEIKKYKYPRDDNIIRRVNSVFTHVLRRISKKKEVIAWYDQRSIRRSIRSVRNKIEESNDPILELIKFWCITLIFVIITVFLTKKEIIDRKKKK